MHVLMAGALAIPAIGLSTAATAAERCPGTVPDGIGMRLAEAPSNRRDDPRAQLYIVDHVKPGATIRRTVVASNGEDEAVRLRFYPAAAQVEGGRFQVIEGRSRNELSGWTTMSPGEATLRPGECQEIDVTIKVPRTAERGERYAVALAELPAQQRTPGSVAVASRVGVRIYLSVGKGAEPTTDFEVTRLTAARQDDGRPAVLATVRNTGARAIDVSGELVLAEGPNELRAGPFPARLGTTLEPGATGQVSVVLEPAVPRGPWQARLTLRSGETERSVRGDITFPEAKGSAAEPVTVDDVPEGRTPLLLIGALLAALVLAALAALPLLRRRLPHAGAGAPSS